MPKQRHQNPKIQNNKDGSFYVRPWIDEIGPDGNLTRKQRTIPLGPAELGKRGAVTKKNEVMGKINQSKYFAQAQITLDTLLGEYKSHVAKLGFATQCKYEALISKHIQPAFGACGLGEITTKVIQDWLDAKTTLSWNTKTDIRNVLSGIFTQARKRGYWPETKANPTMDVWVGRKMLKREKRKLSITDTQRLLAELEPMPRLVCCIGLFTTLRISEILGLQEKRLNFEDGIIEVRQRFYRGDIDRTKTDKSTRNVAMGGLVEWLRGLCIGDPEHYIVQSHKSCATDENLRKRHLTPAAKRIGIYYEGFGFHAMRREAITEIGKRIGVQAVMNMAGHTKMDLTMLYSLTDTAAQRPGQEEYMRSIIQ